MGVSLPWPLVPGEYKPDGFEDRVQQNFDAIARNLSRSATATGWTDLALLNGWTHYAGGGATTAQAKLDPSGVVRLRGEISSGTTTADTVIAQLPDGMEPPYRVVFPVVGDVAMSVYVHSNGELRVHIGAAVVGLNLGPVQYSLT